MGWVVVGARKRGRGGTPARGYCQPQTGSDWTTSRRILESDADPLAPDQGEYQWSMPAAVHLIFMRVNY